MESSSDETGVSALLKDVVAYVEVRSNNDNRSAAVCRELQRLGARVESSFTDDVTHVVFKEGMRRTYNKAQKKGIPLVSVSWLESCKTNQKLMPEKDYAAIIPEETNTGSPLFRLNPHRRWRKMKSMQPYDYEEEVARSAERSAKRRRRVEEANRFKLLEGSTPTSSSPSMVLVPETQGRSPFHSDLSRSNSPSLRVVADTPITPTMKERIERMRQEQNILGQEEQSPKGIGRQKPAMLQKRLFEKLAKDIFSTEDSDDEDEDTTARVVAKLIDGLESQEEDVGSPRKRLKRMSSNDNIQGQLGSNESDMTNIHNLRKSPRQNSQKTGGLNDHKDQDVAALSSPRTNSQNNKTTKTTMKKEETNERFNSLKMKSPTVSKTSHSREDVGLSSNHKEFPVLNNKLTEGHESYGATTSKRKRMLLSEVEVCSALQDPQLGSVDTKALTETKSSKKKEKDNLKEDVSFFFGHKNKANSNLATNRRRSARLNVLKNGGSDGDEYTTYKKNSMCNSRIESNQVPTTNIECGKEKNSCHMSDTDQLSNDSMSVIYDQDSSVMNESSNIKYSRRSIDEFSLGSKWKSANFKKHRASLPGRHNPKASKLSSIADSESSEMCGVPSSTTNNCLSQRGKKRQEPGSNERRKSSPTNNKIQTCDSSESEDLPRKLRHASSLVMEKAANPMAKRSPVFLVMTSLHRHEQEIMLSVVKKLGVFKLSDNVDDSTTHVICGEPRRTLNLLRAITRGCWVLRKEWAFESLEAGKWLQEEKYEMAEDFPVVKDTRCNRMRNGSSFKTDLFSGLGPIFVAKTCVPPRKDLVDLISLCCGSVTSSQQRAAVFIDGDFSINRTNIKPVWILDSIMKMEVLPQEDYAVQAPCKKEREGSPEF